MKRYKLIRGFFKNMYRLNSFVLAEVSGSNTIFHGKMIHFFGEKIKKERNFRNDLLNGLESSQVTKEEALILPIQFLFTSSRELEKEYTDYCLTLKKGHLKNWKKGKEQGVNIKFTFVEHGKPMFSPEFEKTYFLNKI